MLKKNTAILMMTLAYAILLGHSTIPHHHHDNEHDLAQHHQTDHHHDGDENGKDPSHLLSHLIHLDDGFTFTISNNITNTISKKQLSVVVLLHNDFSIPKFHIPPLLHKPPAEHLIYISPHSLSSGLRAPPAFIG